jgi:hypothetical protein
VLVCALAALAATGCFRTVVRSGQPPGEAPAAYDHRWHSGWLAGLVEASGPHPLEQACPGGWAEVRTETDPLHSFLNVLTTFIYSPQSVGVVCAAEGTPTTPPPRDGYDVPPLPSASAYPPPATKRHPPPLPPHGAL